MSSSYALLTKTLRREEREKEEAKGKQRSLYTLIVSSSRPGLNFAQTHGPDQVCAANTKRAASAQNTNPASQDVNTPTTNQLHAVTRQHRTKSVCCQHT